MPGSGLKILILLCSINCQIDISCDRVRNLLQPVEAHTLIRVETYQLHCCGRAETDRTPIWWNLGVRVQQDNLHKRTHEITALLPPF